VPESIGKYAYTVDGTTNAAVRVTPEFRRVTLRAKRHGFRPGSKVLLHGTLESVVEGAPPTGFGPRMPVMVFARPDRSQPWHRVGVVTAEPLKKLNWPHPHSVWHLWVRPRAHATYIAVAKSDLQFWQRAQSKPFGVYVRRR
jgi:hypothetical protein